MKIIIYAEPLKAFTSSNPMRGWVKEFIKLRQNDDFTIVFRDKPVKFKNYFDELLSYKNVKSKFLSLNSKVSNIIALLGLKYYNFLNIEADLCISPGDPDYFYGFKGKTICFLADLSSLRNPKNSSLKWHGKIIQKNILKFAVKYTNKIICISNFTKKDLNDLYPITSTKTEVVYNGISDFWFDDDYIDMDIAKDFKSVNGEYFVWYGAITPRKNLNNILKAYKLIEKKNIFPKILIIGEIQFHDKEFIELTKELEQYVKIIPFQELKVLKGYIKESLGVLFPSFYEGFGLPIIESFALGKNVLHSNVTSLPEIANNLGIEINPYSINSIKEGFIKLAKKETTEIVIQRKKYASEFNYKTAALKFFEIIKVLKDEKQSM